MAAARAAERGAEGAESGTDASPDAAAEPVSEPAAGATAADIDRLIHDLQDPEARAALIRELEVLRSAQREAEPAQPLAEFDLMELTRQLAARVAATWERGFALDASWLLEHLLWSLVVIAGILLIDRWARAALARLAPRLAERTNRVDLRGLQLGRRVVRLSLLGLALVLLVAIWGGSPGAWLRAAAELEWISALVSVVFIVTAGLVLWTVSDALIANAVARHTQHLHTARQRARLRTVTPLLQGALRITIATLAVLLILAEIGINIGPLLAGAGIVGLAVGFGAQSLIKDVLVGVTLLLEDAASVGDVVDVGPAIGQVEDMSIRMMRLRDLEGSVYVVPYSEITVVKNLTKDYAYALLDVPVAYKESIDEVIEALRRVARDMRADPELGPLILEDLQVFGVDELAESAVIVRVRLMTVALERWRVAREFRRRLKAQFDAVGIEIPLPHRTIYFGEGKHEPAPPLRVEDAGP
ncbi:MAG: mechanosensitive ion channel family protein [Pseudomonadota bacterium]